MGEERGVYSFFLWKPEGRRSLGSPRRKCVDKILCGYPGGGMWVCGLDWTGPE